MDSKAILKKLLDKGLKVNLLKGGMISVGDCKFDSRKPILVAVHPYCDNHKGFIKDFEALLVRYNGPIVTLETEENLEARITHFINLGRINNVYFIPTGFYTSLPPGKGNNFHTYQQRNDFFNLFLSNKILLVGGYFGYACQFEANLPLKKGNQVSGCLGTFASYMAFQDEFEVKVLPKYIYGFK